MALAVAERPAAYAAHSERALASLWARAHTLADALVTEGGRRLRVIYPGRQSARAGPDFRDAVLQEEDGGILTGDIELHTSAPGWYDHRHHFDANYNGVVLHVVFSPKGHADTRQQSGTHAPIVAMHAAAADTGLDTGLDGAAAVDGLPGALPDTLTDDLPDALPNIPMLAELRQSADIGAALDGAGDARFAAKCHGFALEIGGIGADEALYRGVMDALGYATNRKPFLELAERVSYRTLAGLRDEPPSTRILAIKALLLGASGLMDLVADAENPALLRRMRKRLPKVASMSRSDWRLFRVRPSNHPVRRIIGAAHLLDGCLDAGIAGTLADALAQGGGRALTARLEHAPHIGKARARDMLVNVALPCLRAYAVHRGDDTLAAAAADAYAKAPKLQENEITREMRRLCAIDKGVKMTARRQQGLIFLYKAAVRGR